MQNFITFVFIFYLNGIQFSLEQLTSKYVPAKAYVSSLSLN